MQADAIWLPAASLCRRELTRFFRQRDRIAGALATPLVFWLLIGSGMGHGYLQYLFPGVVALVLLFTAIFTTISVIEDRREGFLQAVLVAPVAPVGIVLGKLAGGALIATLQAALFLALGPWAGVSISLGGGLAALVLCGLLAFGLTGLGFLLAWQLDSVQGFHAVMNLLLMPMWLLSGSLFPPEGAAGWLQTVMRLNPMTYGVGVLQQLLGAGTAGGASSLAVNVVATVAFGAVMLGAAVVMVRRPRRRYEA